MGLVSAGIIVYDALADVTGLVSVLLQLDCGRLECRYCGLRIPDMR